MAYDFQTEEAKTLYERAGTKGTSRRHLNAFAWREAPARVDRVVSRCLDKKSPEERAHWLQTCLLAAEAQERDRKARTDRIVRPKGLAVWLGDGSWGDDIESVADRQTKPIIAPEKLLEAHRGQINGDVQKTMARLGFDKLSPKERSEACRKWVKENIRGVIKGKLGE